MLVYRKKFPAPSLCSLFARAKMLHRRLVDDVVEIVVLLQTIFFSLFVVCSSAGFELRVSNCARLYGNNS